MHIWIQISISHRQQMFWIFIQKECCAQVQAQKASMKTRESGNRHSDLVGSIFYPFTNRDFKLSDYRTADSINDHRA